MNRTSRKLSLFGVLATLIAALCVVFLGQDAAQAHGVAMMPGSRTYLCYEDALTSTGALTPTNPACAAAVAQSGTTPLYNWFAVLDSNAGGRGQGYVPDGTICSAGDKSPYDFSAYNAARSDWPRTHLTSGSTIQTQYSNWAAHPGTFKVYVTKQGWAPTTPLAWADLEQIGSITNPPSVGSPGTDGGHYYWDLTLPANRSGDALIFIQWVRSDSNENFFSCSDIAFDGGNGEVTGINNGGTTQPPTSQPPTTEPPTTEPPTTEPPTTEPPTSPPPTTMPPVDGACMATYAVSNVWSGGFQAEVTVMNHGTSPSGHWQVNWTPGSGTQITTLWNGTLSSSGGTVSVANAAYNGTIAPDGSTTFGFTANSTGNNLPNGSITCTFA
ncbi:lytic polysaccharide monooxygenase [Actinacidiphila sp. ITFR-21]|uniref:lytic polysaccharide monooxygenase n=1 Tax=Actinacidiphila sp. ITFR-21 TaxID=3075199 RepID=UPI00288C2B59|nr:lytic polysaccharide monooxygenase [Streptomyces sp. ITFR-21]WNI19664.1 lytic polysaccharide monooxygenase [Streptomyces sp. ITFR-21]